MRTAPRSADAAGRTSSAVADGADGGAGTPDAASAGASTTPTGRPARAKTSAASSASAPPQSESGGRRRASSAEPATAAAISTAAAASAAVVSEAGHHVLAGAGEAARERVRHGHAGGAQRRAGEDGDLGQRVGEPDGVVEVGERRRHGVAAGEAADPLGHAARPGGRGAGRQPHEAGAERHVVLGHAAGEDERRRRRLGRGLRRGALGAQQLERRRVHARDVVFAEHAQGEARLRRQDRARLAAPRVVGSVTGCSLLPRRARPAAGRGSSAPARTRAARRAAPACAPPRAP